MLYDDFQPVVDLVLNNWTALQLAVEHGMGAPGGEKILHCLAAREVEVSLAWIASHIDIRGNETVDEYAKEATLSGCLSLYKCYAHDLTSLAKDRLDLDWHAHWGRTSQEKGAYYTAQLMSVYIARYCVENIVDRDELTEVLEDLMDEEFDTVCHDNSPKEIASVLLLYLSLLKEGRHDELRARIEAMPKCQKWLSQPIHESVPPQYHGNPDDDTTSSSSEEDDDSEPMNDDLPMYAAPSSNVDHPSVDTSQPSSSQTEPMDEDELEPGWTVVRTRRRK